MLNRTNEYEWVRCCNCGHKLFRADAFCPESEKALVVMEAKCHSCGSVNSIVISGRKIKVEKVDA